MTPPALRWSGDPAPASWGELARNHAATLGDEARTFRRELELPDRSPIIATGHQSGFWHPGILAKYIAADVLAGCTGGAAVSLVIDQDTSDPYALPVPDAAESGVVELRLARGEHAGRTGARPVEPAGMPDLASEAPGERFVPALRDAVAALGAESRAPSAALHAARANALLLQRWTQARLVPATRIAGTTLFRELLERLLADPAAAIRSYNAAAAAHPDAGVTPLADGELPIWRIDGDGGRHRVLAEERGALASARLAPRALLTTGLLRAAGADLFVHGTGGARYDPVAVAWLGDWAGLDLAPAVWISADLPLLGSVNARAAAAAAWRAHHARHAPVMLDDHEHAARKRELVARIEAAPRASAERASLYAALQRLLADYRVGHGRRLAELHDEAARRRRAADARRPDLDRAWPAILHPHDSLDGLATAIRTLLCGGAQPAGEAPLDEIATMASTTASAATAPMPTIAPTSHDRV